MAHGRAIKRDWDQMCRLLGLPEHDAFEELLDRSDVFIDSEREAAYKRYDSEIRRCVEDAMDKAALEAEYKAGVWQIKTKETWSKSAMDIKSIINGVGLFQFNTLGDFLESGPYTPRDAVESHLGQLKNWWQVYEGKTLRSVYDRRMSS